MRNIIEWLKNHSPLDYLLVVLVIVLATILFKIPGTVSVSHKNSAQLDAVVKEFNKEWNSREAEKKKQSSTNKQPIKKAQADSVDQLIGNFVNAQNALTATYYSELSANNSVDTASNVAYNEKLQAFKQPLTPHLSGGTAGMIIQDTRIPSYSIESSGVSPIGNHRYVGVFKLSVNGQVFAITTYTFDSSTNTISNLSTYSINDVLQNLRRK